MPWRAGHGVGEKNKGRGEEARDMKPIRFPDKIKVTKIHGCQGKVSVDQTERQAFGMYYTFCVCKKTSIYTYKTME